MKEMEIGTWSELSWVCVRQVESGARWAEISVKSGEEDSPFGGSLVCSSEFRRTRLLSLTASRIDSPLRRPPSHDVREFHAGWWALKSPSTRVSPSERLKSADRVASERL